jgi:WD40 repeat protein
MPAPSAALARTIYNGRVSPQLYRFDPAAGGPLAPADVRAERPLRWAAWHPTDGSCLFAGNGGGALRYDGTKLQAIDTGTRHNLRGAAFSPDGTRALLAGNRGAVLLYDPSTSLRAGGAVRAIASPTQENLRRVAWHPSDEYALIVGNAGTVLRYQDGELTPVPGDRAHTLRAIAWRPDGAYALVGAYASRYAGYPRPHALYRCDGRYLQALLASDEEDDFVAVDWHPDGRRALIAGYAYDSQRGTFANKLLT